jgi:glycosyltransferase involved in cell wall biosynthesis
MSLADVFVAPSLFKESFGLVLIEAAASGTLPLGSCHSGFKDVLDYYSQQLGFEKENLCLCLNDEFIKELGNKIIWALEFSKEINKLAENLFELTRKTFSWESAARNLLHLF